MNKVNSQGDSSEAIGSDETLPKETGFFNLKYKVRSVFGTLNFRMPTADLRAAMARAEKHCEVQGYRFIRVDPLFVDLDLEDTKRKQRDVS